MDQPTTGARGEREVALDKKERQRARRAAGLCNSCGEKAVEGKTRCQKHLELASAQSRERYKAFQETGLCQRCKQKPAATGYKYCDECREYCRVVTASHREEYAPKQKEASLKWYAERKAAGICPQCNERPAAPNRVNCEECGRTIAERSMKKYHAQRVLVFDHYGRACACCGEKTIEFLQIDHVDGNGADHRKEIGQSKLYKWLIDNNFPPGFQTLCSSCNFAKGQRGECPHETARRLAREAQQS